MNKFIFLIIGVVLLIVIILNRNSIKKLMTRGYQNNNPGNIRKTAKMWAGEIAGSDKDFKTFKDMPSGYRGIFLILRTYLNNGLNNIQAIINKYAPPVENNTDAYIKLVASRTGKNPTDIISIKDEKVLKQIASAISKMENGVEPSDIDIEKGFTLFKTL